MTITSHILRQTGATGPPPRPHLPSHTPTQPRTYQPCMDKEAVANRRRGADVLVKEALSHRVC